MTDSIPNAGNLGTTAYERLHAEIAKAENVTIPAIYKAIGEGSLNNYATVADLATQIARINSFTKLAEGSTTGDAELIDARIVNGKTYENLGEAIRAISSGVALEDGVINKRTLVLSLYTLLSRINTSNLINNPVMDETIGEWNFRNSAYSNNYIEGARCIEINIDGFAYTPLTNFKQGKTYYISFKYFTVDSRVTPQLKILGYNDSTFQYNVIDTTVKCKTEPFKVNRLVTAFQINDENINKLHIAIFNPTEYDKIYFSQMYVGTSKDGAFHCLVDDTNADLYLDDNTIAGATEHATLLNNNTIRFDTYSTDAKDTLLFRVLNNLDGIDNKIITMNVNVEAPEGTKFPINIKGFFVTYNDSTAAGNGTMERMDATLFENGTLHFEYNKSMKNIKRVHVGIYSPCIDATIILSDIQQIPKLLPINPLYNKRLSCNGDSIMQGITNGGGFAKLIAQNNSMHYENIAIGGGTVATGTVTNTGTNRHWICTSIVNQDPTADYVLLDGLVNDFWLKVPLGAITSNFTDEVDNTTFYGGLEYMFRSAYDHFSINAKILYVIPHNINNLYYATSNGVPFMKYYNAVLEVCKKYSIPVVDLFSEGRYNTYSDKYKADCINNGDGVHATDHRYRVTYVNPIESKARML